MMSSTAYFKEIDRQRQRVICNIRRCVLEHGDQNHAEMAEILESSKHLAIKESEIAKAICGAMSDRGRKIANAKSAAADRVISMVLSGGLVEYSDCSNTMTEAEFAQAIQKGKETALERQNQKIANALSEITTAAQSIHQKRLENTVARAMQAGVPQHFIDEALSRGKEVRALSLLHAYQSEAFSMGAKSIIAPCGHPEAALDGILAKVKADGIDGWDMVKKAYQDGRDSVEQKRLEFERKICFAYPEEWFSSFTLIGIDKSFSAVNSHYYKEGESLGYSDDEIAKLLDAASDPYEEKYREKCDKQFFAAVDSYNDEQTAKNREELIFRFGRYFIHRNVNEDDVADDSPAYCILAPCLDIFYRLLDAGKQCFDYRKKHDTKKSYNRDFNKDAWKAAKNFGIPEQLFRRIGVLGYEEAKTAKEKADSIS